MFFGVPPPPPCAAPRSARDPAHASSDPICSLERALSPDLERPIRFVCPHAKTKATQR
jgi:hypothetical protein